MSINDFIMRIEEEFEDIEQGVLTPDSVYKDELEWSSISSLVMITLVITESEVTINANDLKNSKTIKDLYTIIENRREN